MRPLKEKLTITIDNDVLKQIKVLAEKEERSVSQYITMVLRQHLNKNAKLSLNDKTDN